MRIVIDAEIRHCIVGRVVRAIAFSTVAALVLPATGTRAEDVEFNRDVKPILAEYCFACHGADSAAREAGLRLDQRQVAIDFAAIVPGSPDDSELLLRVLADDPDMVMPPPETKKQLSDDEIETLRKWLQSGAEYQEHWAFIAPEPPAVPKLRSPDAGRQSDWVKNPIDAFVLRKLDSLGLSPAPEADARTLFRRLHLDITGLTPDPADAAAFEADYARAPEMALNAWIDRLMNTPAWGEHRGRYWLDAARYGDTHGLHFDNYREMWPYRDWVIRSFNANQPFDEFTLEQLAGDLLDEPSEDQLIATGFQRCNITTNEGGTIDEENLANYAIDRVQTFGWVFLGLTTNCSQCHDHKFDPITQADYYALSAYFRNTTQGPKDGNVKDGRGPVLVIPSMEDRERWEALPEEIQIAKSAKESRSKVAKRKAAKWAESVSAEHFATSVPTGPVLYLPLNEGQGNSVRSSDGLASEFQAASDLEWTTEGLDGPALVIRPGKTPELGSAESETSSGFGTAGLGDFERDRPFSVSVWIKPANKKSQGAIVAKMDESNAHRGWDLWQNGSGYSVHMIDSWPENAIKMTTKADVVKPGTWQHVCMTYNGSGKPGGFKIYVDGQPQDLRADSKTLTKTASIRTSTILRIGQRHAGSTLSGASVQHLHLFDRKLPDDEVQALADGPLLQVVLRVPASERTAAQSKTLTDYYLNRIDPEFPQLVERLSGLEAELSAIRARSPVTHIQQEKMDSPAMANILIRGEYDNVGEPVMARTPAALHPMPENAPPNRLGLARWVIDPANPLTARVTVNRFWQEVFGQGLVVTSEDFGIMGMPPSHPELLDWLAVEFKNNNWDVRHLFRLMLTSATYRQRSLATPDKVELDRTNVWLSRGPRFRMDAEMLRDNAMRASGLLSSKMFGPGTKPYQPEAIWDIVGLPGGDTRNYVQDQGEDLYRRTLYTFWKRMAPPPSLEAFNAPSREVCTVRRERTNTPLQALVTLNDPTYFEAARVLAAAALQSSTSPPVSTENVQAIDAQLQFVASRVLSRRFSPRELSLLREDLDAYQEYYSDQPQEAELLLTVGEAPRGTDADASRLAAWTMLCNQVLNLDEAITK